MGGHLNEELDDRNKHNLIEKKIHDYMMNRETNQQKLKLQLVKKLMINLKEEKMSFLKNMHP